MKKLAGVVFMRNAVSLDYCFEQCIKSMSSVCDCIYVLDAGSDDGTREQLMSLYSGNEKIVLILLPVDEWDKQKGKEKLSYFTNISIDLAEKDGYEYVLNIQADEVLSERSYEAIRAAIQSGAEAFMCSRINLWGSPFTYLSVEDSKQPCSTKIIRLAKSKYRSVDDAESIGVSDVSFNFLKDIKIWHMGFVRDKYIMKDKVIHMQEGVFGVDHDEKLDGVDYFDSERWFSGNDLSIIEEPLPTIIKDWAIDRELKNKNK